MIRINLKNGIFFFLDKYGIYLLVLFFTFIYSLYSTLNHLHFGTHAFDLGIFDQTIWHYSNLEFAENTIRNTPNLLGDHFHPILILLGPIYWLWDNVIMLLIVQSFLVCLAAVPLFLIAFKKLRSKFAAYVIVLTYLMHWGIQGLVGFDFHEIAFFMPIFAYAIYFLEEKKWVSFFISIILLLMVKENISIIVFFIGVYLFIKKEYLRGFIVAVLGVAWFFLTTKIIIPLISGSQYSYWTLTTIGKDAIEATKTIIFSPFYAAEVFLTPIIKIKTMIKILLPFLFLPVLSPFFIIALPTLAERFFSTNNNYWTTDFHYTATISIILAISIIYGIENLYKLVSVFKIKYKKFIFIVSFIVLSINLLLLFLNITPNSIKIILQPSFYNISKQEREIIEFSENLSRDYSVTAQDTLVPHLSHRNKIYQLDITDYGTDYIFINIKASTWPLSGDEHSKRVAGIISNENYGLSKIIGDWAIIKKGEKSLNYPADILNYINKK